MNVLSFRRSSWYLSGVFILIVIVLTLICIIVFNDVFSFITTLFSSVITLLISYNNDYNGLPVALNIKPGVYNLDDHNPNAYSLPV